MMFSQILKDILNEAGNKLLKLRESDAVTESIDTQIEQLITSQLRQNFPDIGIFSEENGWHFLSENEFVWCVDPLDGTLNYIRGLPAWGISIALLEDKKPIVGAIYLPEIDEFYYAERDKGATCNAVRLDMQFKPLHQSLISYPLENMNLSESTISYLTKLISVCGEVRMYNASAVELAYLASGYLDGYIINDSPRVWDIAAGIVIVEEAGGRITDIHDQPHRLECNSHTRYSVLASHPKLHSNLYKCKLEI